MANEIFTIETGPVEVRLKILRKGLEDASKLLGEIGTYISFSLLTRTEKGIDAEGASFKPYSKPYKKVREEKGLPTAKVDLFFTGRMLSALTYEETKDRVRLFFLDTPRKEGGASNAAIAFYNDEIRKFFSISSHEQKVVLNLAKTYFEDLLER